MINLNSQCYLELSCPKCLDVPLTVPGVFRNYPRSTYRLIKSGEIKVRQTRNVLGSVSLWPTGKGVLISTIVEFSMKLGLMLKGEMDN